MDPVSATHLFALLGLLAGAWVSWKIWRER